MEGTLATAAAPARFRTVLLAAFAVLALTLAVAGVYAVMAYTVRQRVPELGVRMALGATPRDVLTLVLRQGAQLTAAGVSLGVLLALATTRLLSGLLFDVTPHDLVVLASVSAIVSLAALTACLIPARDVLRVDPAHALRET
jgi:ABC-type antimicrobial peptide transport system permease subunit